MAKVLLINPWITDFTAFDLWSKPVGLLYLADLLRKNDIHVDLLDCLDRRHPLVEEKFKISDFKTGPYRREIIEKPFPYRHIPRNFARYGISYQKVKKYLTTIDYPDLIALTSGMTYWYTGLMEMVDLCRTIFPDTPIIIGGTYATLLPKHAEKILKPDYLARGPLQKIHTDTIGDLLGKKIIFQSLKKLRPLWSLYSKLDYLVMITSQGCPFQCDFCASRIVAGKYDRRAIDDVISELADNYKTYKISNISFYDDALFVNSEQYVKPLLKKIIDLNLPFRFHTPNGVHSNLIDSELAMLLKASNFTSLRLSFESASPNQIEQMDHKVSSDAFFRAFENLLKAGYNASDLKVYLMAGLPGQTWEEIHYSVETVHKMGAQVSLNAWSPIPGTEDFNRAIELGLWDENNDPLLTNPTCLPNLPEGVNYSHFVQFMTEIKIKNADLNTFVRVR